MAKLKKGKKRTTEQDDYERASKNFWHKYKGKKNIQKALNDYFGSDANPKLISHVKGYGQEKGYYEEKKVSELPAKGKPKKGERNIIAYQGKGENRKQVFSSRTYVVVKGKKQIRYRDSKGRFSSVEE